MMSQKCAIIDDERAARNILRSYVSRVPFLELEGEFQNAIEALEHIKRYKIDILFLDIEMPILSGLNLVKILDPNIQIIITSAHRDYAIKGFELSVLDYLLKPFSFERFLQAVNKAKKVLGDRPKEISPQREKPYTYFKSDRKNIKVEYDEIVMIEGLSNYVKIRLVKNKVLIVYERLSHLVTMLPDSEFVRIHRSYIISLDKIKVYTNDFVEIGGTRIPISNTYRKSFLKKLSNYLQFRI